MNFIRNTWTPARSCNYPFSQSGFFFGWWKWNLMCLLLTFLYFCLKWTLCLNVRVYGSTGLSFSYRFIWELPLLFIQNWINTHGLKLQLKSASPASGILCCILMGCVGGTPFPRVHFLSPEHQKKLHPIDFALLWALAERGSGWVMAGGAQQAAYNHARSWWRKWLMAAFPFYGIVSSCKGGSGLNLDVCSRPERTMELKWHTFTCIRMRHARKHCHVDAFIMREPEVTGRNGKVFTRRLFQKAVPECVAAVREPVCRVMMGKSTSEHTWSKPSVFLSERTPSRTHFWKCVPGTCQVFS